MIKRYFSCFKQLPSNFTAIFELWIRVGFGARLLSDVAGDLMLSLENPLKSLLNF